MEFHCRLKVIFAEREIKQKAFAQEIGISNTTLSMIVTNKSLPTFKVAYKIARNLELHMGDIWILKQDKTPSND